MGVQKGLNRESRVKRERTRHCNFRLSLQRGRILFYINATAGLNKREGHKKKRGARRPARNFFKLKPLGQWSVLFKKS